MSYKIYISIFLLVLICKHVEGYGSGAPPSQCGPMSPSHGTGPQNTAPPYTLTLSSNTYKLGETINVTLQSTANPSAGYIIVAKDSPSLATIHGQFTNADSGRILTCGDSSAGGVTHTTSQGKTSVEFQWQPTSNTAGPVVFIATVVESYSTFWKNIKTTPITPEGQSSQIPPTTTVQPPPSGSLPYDTECGDTKGCFVDCTGNTCNYVVTWKDNGNSVDFEISTVLSDSKNKWIGIAFSDDLKMGSDEVVACFNVGGSTDIERSYNDGQNNIQIGPGQAGLSNKVVRIENGVFKCSFTKSKQIVRRKRQTSSGLFVNLDNDYNLMLGTGPASAGNRVGYHTDTPVVTSKKVDFQSVEVIGDTAKYPLIKVHACLMIIAWMFCTGVGIIAARYYKPVWSESTFFSQKIWFQIHRTLMVTAMIFTVVGFIVIFIEVEGYSKISSRPGKEYLPSHPILGIIVTILCILNPIMSLFRPGPTNKNRPVFNWAHWGVGIVAQILAIITICFGLELQKSTAPKYTVWVVVGFVVYYMIMDIIQKIIDKLADKKGIVESFDMKQNRASNGSLSISEPVKEDKTNKKDTPLKKSILAVHAIVTLGFTLAIILLVAMN